MKISTITFHGAQNFGSVLQTYALKHFVEEICRDIGIKVEYRVINFRSDFQRNHYAPLPKVNSVKTAVKLLMRIPYYRQYKLKHKRFELFLSEELNCGPEFSDASQINQLYSLSDLYISGSDQIWNVRARDFDEIYFLSGIESLHKISYSASFGPLDIDWREYDFSRYSTLLNDYSALSVREQGSANNVNALIGKMPAVHVDPTLLLDREEWKLLETEGYIPKHRYILFYCLEPTAEQLEIAQRISSILGMPIVAMRYNNKYDYINNFLKYYDAGPKEFLALLKGADLVLTSSFHGTAFSIIYEKPFLSFNGDKDNRIKNLLTLSGLSDRVVNKDQIEEKTKAAFQIDFSNARKIIAGEKEKSYTYLKGEIEKCLKATIRGE